MLLRKINESDSASILPPRAYDISGTLIASLGLEKESHGNADQPIEAIHGLLYQNDSLWVAGNFRNYCGANVNGLAKLGLDGKLATDFNIQGFDKPIRTVVALEDGSKDVIVAGLEPAGLNGYNGKPFTRLTYTGVESSVQTTVESDITADNQNRVLDIISLPDNNFLVLTPRKLQVRGADGSIIKNYSGSLGNSIQYNITPDIFCLW